jgi:hypothetical protein
MKNWLLTAVRRLVPTPKPTDEPLRARVVRLEIEAEELRSLVQAVWARQRKVEGTVHGMRGANNRWPSRVNNSEESLEEYRDRMQREGRLGGARAGENHGEH